MSTLRNWLFGIAIGSALIALTRFPLVQHAHAKVGGIWVLIAGGSLVAAWAAPRIPRLFAEPQQPARRTG